MQQIATRSLLVRSLLPVCLREGGSRSYVSGDKVVYLTFSIRMLTWWLKILCHLQLEALVTMPLSHSALCNVTRFNRWH